MVRRWRSALQLAVPMLMVACGAVPDPDCPARQELLVGVDGAIRGLATISFGDGKKGSGSDTLIPVRVTLRRQTSGSDAVLVGIAACKNGVVRARLTSSHSESPRVLGAALEAIYRPQLVRGDLVGAYAVQLERTDGTGVTDLSGFFGPHSPMATPLDGEDRRSSR